MKKFLLVLLFLLITPALGWSAFGGNYCLAQTPTPTLTPRPTFQPTCSPSPVPPTATPTMPVSGVAEVTALAIFGGAVFVILGILFYKSPTSKVDPY